MTTVKPSSLVTSKPVQLDWRSEDGQIVVTPKSQDRFMLQMRTAVDVLQQANQEEQFHIRFRLLLQRLAKWIGSSEDVSNAYITLRDGSLAFVVVRKTAKYNAQFEDSLTDLEFDLANDPELSVIEVEVIGLPNISIQALDSFLHTDFSLRYGANN